MKDLLAEVRHQPGLRVGGLYHRAELRTAEALVSRGLITLEFISKDEGWIARPAPK